MFPDHRFVLLSDIQQCKCEKLWPRKIDESPPVIPLMAVSRRFCCFLSSCFLTTLSTSLLNSTLLYLFDASRMAILFWRELVILPFMRV